MGHGERGLSKENGVGFWLGPESPLAQGLEGYAPRQGQLEMARAVEDCLGLGNPLLVEAGTGTGKTMAYLVPAVESGLKAVVSTGTRTLQDQVSSKELPLLKKHMDPGLSWAVLKGRGNYLCLLRYEQFAAQPALDLPRAAQGLAMVGPWAMGTFTGDLDEVRGRGLSVELAGEITANSEQCLGGRCPRREECHLMEARRRASEADIVVVNHHLFLADLKLKAGGHGEALPRYQAVVFDEAHLLADTATQIFGVSVSRGRVRTLLKDLARDGALHKRAALQASEVEAASASLFGKLRRMATAGSMGLSQRHLEALAPLGERLARALEDLAAGLGEGEMPENLAARAMVLSHELSAVASPVPGRTVAWTRADRAGAALNLSPVEVGPYLRDYLYQDCGRLVFTSATLALAGDLGLSAGRLGLAGDAGKLVVPSPFDQAKQALLYVPRSMPPPNDKSFALAVAREVEELLGLTGGRAFVLFTSHRNLEAVSGLLAGKLPFPCLVQGSAPRMKLLQKFVEQSPSVLFATASFWQGVDVPGPALSAVIVDKLPFAPPDDPLVAARGERLEREENKSSFFHLMLPEAVLSLKQGLGRLLRTPSDRGLLAVLDVRLRTKGYGKAFLKALKPVPLTGVKDDVAAFFKGR